MSIIAYSSYQKNSELVLKLLDLRYDYLFFIKVFLACLSQDFIKKAYLAK